MSLSHVVQTVANLYLTGPLQLVEPVKAGFLSQNYILNSGSARYFLKQYETHEQSQVESIHAAKFFFANAGIPVILPLKTRSGETYRKDSGNYYSLFPYVEARQLLRGRFSEVALASTAAILAKIHLAGRNAALSNIQVQSLHLNKVRFIGNAQNILRLIEQQSIKTDFDELASESIRLKLSLVNQLEDTFPDLRLESDHLTHGDYQEANLFFDDRDRVSYVFDWEKVRMAPRAMELVRSIELICFSNHMDYRPAFANENYWDTHIYLEGYHSHYPFRQEELMAAYRIHYLRAIHSLWVETEHYINRNTRVDIFLLPGLERLQYYADHLATHVERISNGIFGYLSLRF